MSAEPVVRFVNHEVQVPASGKYAGGVGPNVGVNDVDELALDSHHVAHHQRAESRISVNRLRWRLRNQTTAIKTSTMRPRPAPTMKSGEAQSLSFMFVHSFTAPKRAAKAIALDASFMDFRISYEHDMRA
jgi:hypothetical protein